MSESSTERRFISSTVASYVGLAVRMVVRFAFQVVIARLVLPEGHGLFDLALRVVFVASVVRDLGLPFHLMRDPRRPYGTVLAFSLGQAGVITALLLVGSPLAALIDPQLPAVVRMMAPLVILDALVVVPKVFFERELRIGRLIAPEIARGVTVAVVAVGLAASAGWQVGSLVAGELAAASLFALLIWRRAWGVVPLAVDLSLLPDLLRKSVWLFQIWVVLTLVTYVDQFIVGFFGSLAEVGYYGKAYLWAFLVAQIVAPRALLPALVEYRDDPERFLTAFRLGTVFLLAFQVTGGYFLFFNAERVVGIVLGPGWEAAVPLLKVLCFVPFLDVFTDLGGEVLKVRHEDRVWLLIALINLASLVCFGILFTRRWGALGMAWANFLLLGNLVMAWRMSRIFARGFRRIAQDLVLIYLVPLACFLLAALLPAASWSRFAASFVAAAAALGLLALRFYEPFESFFGPVWRRS